MKQLYLNTKGFTLIEMLIVVAILGAIMGAMAMTINVTLINYDTGHDRSVALRQIEQAGFFISNDAQMASSVNTTSLGNFVQMSCYTTSGTQNITYTFSGTTLNRMVGAQNTMAIQDINPDPAKTNITFRQSDNCTILNITAVYNSVSQNGTYIIQRRVPQ